MGGDHLNPHKDVKAFIRFAKNYGFHLAGRTGSGHWRLRHAGGGSVILPATPSCRRWTKNAKADVLRIHREHQEKP